MKSIQKQNKSLLAKKILLTILIVVVVSILSITGMFIAKTGPFNEKSVNITTQKNSKDYTNSTPTSSPTDSSKTPIKNQPVDNDTSTNTITASITYIRQTSSGLQIGTLIEGIVSNGSCKLTLTKDGKEVTDKVGVQASSSSSTCKGFDVPIIKLSAGTWSIKIDISANSKEAHLSDSVVIK